MTSRRKLFHAAGLGAISAFLPGKTLANTNKTRPAKRDIDMTETSMLPQRHDPFPVAEPYHGIYAHGVDVTSHSRTLYISGQIGVAPDGFLDPTFEGQCRQAFENLFAVLRSAHMTPHDLVKMSFYLTRPQDMGSLVNIRRDLIDGVRPAVTTLFVSGLVSPDWFVEIEAIAATTPIPRGVGSSHY